MHAHASHVSAERRRLSDLAVGDRATVDRVDFSCPTARRFVALGFSPGATVTLARLAPLADPMEFDVRGARVSLRRSDAAAVWVRA